MGTTTFGKGLIQTIADLSDGSGLSITLARYQTPLGLDINKVGVEDAPSLLMGLREPLCTLAGAVCDVVDVCVV